MQKKYSTPDIPTDEAFENLLKNGNSYGVISFSEKLLGKMEDGSLKAIKALLPKTGSNNNNF